jgi:hypothetical protein
MSHSLSRVTSYRQWCSESLALCIYSFMLCGVVGCLCIWFYDLMQPEWHPNPGLAAHRPPPATVVLYSQQSGPKDEIYATVSADATIEPAPEAVDTRPPQSTDGRASRESKTPSQKRRHAVPSRRSHNPITDYAAQPFVFDHSWRPWR